MTTAACASPDGTGSLRVLLVEDSAADAELALEMLDEVSPDTVVCHVSRLDEALVAVRQDGFDVALVDLSLPDAEGLSALHALRLAAPHVLTVVVLTGLAEERMAHRALAAGAQDYLVKGRFTADLLGRSLRYAVSRAHAEREAQRSERWAQSVLDAIEAPTCALDTDGVIVAVNAAWTLFSLDNGGDPAACGVGVNYLSMCGRSGEPAAVTLQGDLRRLISTGSGRVELEYPCDSPSGRRWFSLRATPAIGRGAAVVTHVDVTALRQAHDQLDHAAGHDPLTGLINRRLLVQELDRRLRSLRPGRAVAVFFLGLDRFKLINDTLGHTAGDGVLVRIAAELTAAVQPDDLVSRHGGDEFVVVADVRDDEVTATADRLQDAVRHRIQLGNDVVDVAASVGLVVSRPGAGDSADDLLQAVDDAMHEAKERGRGRVELYTDDLRSRSRSRAQLYRELTVAVEQDQFVLHFQPIVAPDVGGIHAVEALVRWQHPERGLLLPGDFIGVAESTDLIMPIGARVIEEACRQGRELHDAGLHLAVTVNLSAKQLNDPRTEDVIAGALAMSGFPAASLIVEVTETTMIDDTDMALASMRAVKALGVQLAVDDFGTGYSSMTYIRRYPVDGLKIDRSFVQDMLTNSDDLAIVASLIRLARDLDLWVIAEGVETRDQLRALRDMGCELVQGFLYARPMPAAELADAARRLAERAPVAVPEAPLDRTRRAPAEDEPAMRTRIAELTARGMSLHTVAAALNAEGLRTSAGLRWHPRSVARALAALPADRS